MANELLCDAMGDRKPSIETAEKLEIATGVCREGWLWPDRHHNPYIPFYHGDNCLSCINRNNRTWWMVERIINLTKKAGRGSRLQYLFKVITEVHAGMGFPKSLKIVFLAIKPEGFLCLFVAGESTLPPPYLIPFSLVPVISREILKGKVFEMEDVYDARILNSPMDAAWIAERKCKALFAVPSKRLVLVTAADAGGPTYEWTDETVAAMKWMMNELDELLGAELNDPLIKLDAR